MTDRVFVPLPDGRWLALAREAFDAALTEGAAEIGAPAPAAAGTGDSEALMDAEALAAALHLPQTWLEQAAREGRIPCVRAGRWVRFRRSLVEATLSRNRTGEAA